MTDAIAPPVDAQTAYDLLAAAVELGGADHTYEKPFDRGGYPACLYVDPDGENPSCLVGVALSVHGVPLDVMRYWDHGTNDGAIDSIVDEGHAPFIDSDAASVFGVAQTRQDKGGTWGEALAAASAQLAQVTS